MKGISIVFNDKDSKFFLITVGDVKETNLKGYEGILIERTIYKSVEKKLLQSIVLWILERWYK